MQTTHITILTGDRLSTKHYFIVDDKPQKGEAKLSYHYNYATYTIRNIDDLYGIIREASLNDNAIVIRGRADQDQGSHVRRLLKSDSNADGVFRDSPTAWLCIDFDKGIVPEHLNRLSVEAIEWLVKNTLPSEFHDASYIFQWSASAGLEWNDIPIKNGCNVHLFFFLDRGLLQPDLKGWLRDNSYIDRSVFGAVQPIFVNANIVKDDGISDLIAVDQKIGLVRKQQDFVKTPGPEQLNQFDTLHLYQAPSLDGDSCNAIIQKLFDVGCITHKSPNTLSLKSPHEKTPGGYYTRIDNPIWVCHGGKPSRRVDQWLLEEWGVEFEIPACGRLR